MNPEKDLTPIRVFLVDDHNVLRQGLRMLIDSQEDMSVVGESDHGDDILDAVRSCNADVVVMDLSMPGYSGIQATAELRRHLPDLKILALSRHSERAYLQHTLQAGASGYILKQTVAPILIEGLRAVGRGAIYLDPAISRENEPVSWDGSLNPPLLSPLTPRELEIASLVAFGHTNKEIAGTLGITVKTVETHKNNLMQKLEITSRAELVRFAMMQGWMQKTTSS